MKAQERDELFGRLDERSLNAWRIMEEIKDHLIRLNGSIEEQGKQVSSNKTSIRWIIRIMVAAVILGSGAIGIVNWIG